MLTKNDYEFFKIICGFTQDNLHTTLYNILKTKYYTNIIDNENYLYAIGNIPITLVAHLDTVFTHAPYNIFYDPHEKVMWSPDGLGADDRAGVFAILKIFQNLDEDNLPSIIFTHDEEKGALGAEALVKDIPKPLTRTNFILQLDRRGENDCVFYDCVNKKFIKYIESFGFKENMGSFSDISEICPAWGVAGANLSVGYYNEHTLTEILCVDYLYSTIEKVQKILSEETIPYFKYKAAPRKFTPFFSSCVCGECKTVMPEDEIVKMDLYGEPSKNLCIDCIIEKVDWCPTCDISFRKNETNSCPICGQYLNSPGGRINVTN